MERALVVGVDGSTDSLHALKWACHLAGLASLELTAVWATRLPIDQKPEPDQLLELERWCSSLGSSSARVKRLVVEGYPADALLRTVREAGAGLVHHCRDPLILVPR